MPRNPKQVELPNALALMTLAGMAKDYALAIGSSPYDLRFEDRVWPLSSGIELEWRPSQLLPADSEARIEVGQPAHGIRGGLLAPNWSQPQEESRREMNAARHRRALVHQWRIALAADPAYGQLHSLEVFRRLLGAFDEAKAKYRKSERLQSEGADAQLIWCVAVGLAEFRFGMASRSLTRRERRKTERLFDKLEELNRAGMFPFMLKADIARSVETRSLLTQLRAAAAGEPIKDRLRAKRNDPWLRHRRARERFQSRLEETFGLPLYPVVERFFGVIGYRNPPAQASR